MYVVGPTEASHNDRMSCKRLQVDTGNPAGHYFVIRNKNEETDVKNRWKNLIE